MDIKINRAQYRDKVYACWLGKNIGGTMGTPFEGNPNLLDIKGFTSPPGEPLPNDDLDLQLIWIHAAEQMGCKGLNANILSWYWKRYISAVWNEYGVGQNNVSVGITPPMSGELFNEGWKTSNGAWIRSEIWACLAPGFPNIATKYAIMEASIDHGVSDGTAAEIFTAALESMAFAEKNIQTLVQKALTYIPEQSRVAQSIRLVMEEHEKGTDWKRVRELVLQQNADLGFFQAPSNIAFVIIGLLYGNGDFLQSLILAINCGDDTDCTGATVGAVLGILGGTQSIPKELCEYIGDKIITNALDTSALWWEFPTTCSKLTERVMRLMPTMMTVNGNYTEYTDDEDAPFTTEQQFDCNGYTHKYLNRKPLTIEHENHWLKGEVSFDGEPRISPEGTLSFDLTLENPLYNVYQLAITVFTPDGWSAAYPKSMTLHHHTGAHDAEYVWRQLTPTRKTVRVTITANENTQAINRVYIAVEAQGYPLPLTIPVTILG